MAMLDDLAPESDEEVRARLKEERRNFYFGPAAEAASRVKPTPKESEWVRAPSGGSFRRNASPNSWGSVRIRE